MHDQVTDRGQIINKRLAAAVYSNCSAFPSKQAGVPDALPHTAYADPVARRFPCHSKEAVLVSAAYLYGQMALGTPYDSTAPIGTVCARMDKAAKFFNATLELESIKAAAEDVKVPEHAEIELPDEVYVLNETHDGKKVLRYPAVNAKTAAAAGSALVANRKLYPYAWRKNAAATALSRIMAFDAPVAPDTIECLSKMAGFVTADSKTAGYDLMCVAERLRGELAATVRNTAVAVGTGAIKSSEFESVCGMLDSAAATLSVGARFMAEDMLFSVPREKQAEAPKTVELTTGGVYSIADLVQAPIDTYRILGDDVASELVDNSGAIDADKLSVVLPTLPRPDASVLETALGGVSIHSTSKEASDASIKNDMSVEGWTSFLNSIGGDSAKVQVNRQCLAKLPHPQAVEFGKPA
jgi:hypothetical protein